MVERGLPWSLPRPFCLSPGFSLPVDPYGTGEIHLAVCVTPQVVDGGGATHTLPGEVTEGLYTETTSIFLSPRREVLRCFSFVFESFLYCPYNGVR